MNRRSAKHGRLIATFVASTLAATTGALVPGTARAALATATLEGHASPGIKIVATNLATGAKRVAVATAAGDYTLAGLQPGRYRVRAGTQVQILVLNIASTVTYNFAPTLLQAPALKRVTITGKRLFDMTTPAVGGLVSQRTIETVPQITRNFLEFANTIPGVTFTVSGNGDTSFRGGASHAQGVNAYIGGFGMEDYVQGGIAGQSGPQKNPNVGDPGNIFPQSAIAQYRVITSNYSARYGQASSAIITAQTKSGTNHFHGSTFVSFTNQNMRAMTPAEVASPQPGNPKPLGAENLEYGFSAGGPIIKNKLHYFFAYEHKYLALPNTVYPGSGTGVPSESALQSLLPRNVYSQFGPTNNPFRENLLFAKIDYEPTENDRIALSELYRFQTQLGNAFGQTAVSASSGLETRFSHVGLTWLHAHGNWTNTLRLGYESAGESPLPEALRPEITYQWFGTAGQTTLINVNGAGPYAGFQNKQTVETVDDNFNLDNLHWLGTHNLEMGFMFHNAQVAYQDASQGANFVYAVNSSGTFSTPYQVTFSKLYAGKVAQALTSETQVALYLEDHWHVNRHLHLDLGVRYGYDSVPSWQNFVTPQAIVDGIYGPYAPGSTETYAQALALGGINIGNYISNGHNRAAQSGLWQPRLGFSYDIEGNGRYVIFGGFAKSYSQNIFDLLSLEQTKAAFAEPTVNFYGGGYSNAGCLTAADASTSCVAWNPAYLNLSNLQSLVTTGVGEVDLINNHIKEPYSDQFSLGFRTQLGAWDVSITLAQINSYNRLMGELGNRTATGGYFVPSSWGAAGVNPAWGGVPGTTGNLVLWNNGGKTRDREVLLYAAKPYTRASGWSATIAYTYSDAYQNDYYSYLTNNAYAFDLPNMSMYYLVPSSAIPKNKLVMTGSINGPWGMVYGAELTLSTPLGFGAAEPCPTTIQQCHNYWDYPVTGFPRNFLWQRELDVEATKYMKVPLYDMRAYVRLDILNVFNTAMYTAADFGPTVGGGQVPQYITNGPIDGVPFTVKLTAGIRW